MRDLVGGFLADMGAVGNFLEEERHLADGPAWWVLSWSTVASVLKQEVLAHAHPCMALVPPSALCEA